MSGRRARGAKRPRREVDIGTLHAIVGQTRAVLTEQDHGVLLDAVDTLAEVTAELERTDVSIRTLRELLFGAKTEKTRRVLGEQLTPPPGQGGIGDKAQGSSADQPPSEQRGGSEKPPRKGHGRNGADAYAGAEQVERTQWTSRRLLTFGLHVHVGIADRALALQIMNEARYFLPHFLALSTNSPDGSMAAC